MALGTLSGIISAGLSSVLTGPMSSLFCAGPALLGSGL